MRALGKKVLLAFFAVLLAALPLLTLRPKPADAFVGCLIGKLFNLGIGAAEDIGTALTSVATHDQSVSNKAGRIAGSSQSIEIKECTLDGVAKMVARTLLHNMTRSIVKWINTGFQGSPSFVTDPKGFLTGVADDVIGREIEAVAPMLCQPFRFQLQIALGFQFSATSQDEVRCRLSDVVQNLQVFYDSFVGGQFSAGGWQSWINIAGVPQNNAYGAYLATQSRIHAGIVNAQGEEIQLLNWGSGFRSWRECKKFEELYEPTTGKTRRGKCIEEGAIKTPGKIIVDQTSSSLQSTLNELEVADEIDEIFGALVNQLLIRAMGGGGSPGGLHGVSRPDSAGIVYINTIPTSLADVDKLANMTKPPDIDCSRNYTAGGRRPGAPAGSRVEGAPYLENLERVVAIGNGSSPTQAQKDAGARALADLKAVYPGWPTRTLSDRDDHILLVEARDANNLPTGLNELARRTDGTLLLKDQFTTWQEYMTRISAGCANEVNRFVETQGEAIARGRLGDIGVTAGTPQGGTPPPQVQLVEGNIAQGKKAELSHSRATANNDLISYQTFPSFAVDGNQDGGRNYGLAMTAPGTREWWAVDLSTDKDKDKPDWSVDEIRNIKIYSAGGEARTWLTLFNQPVLIAITKTPPNGNTAPQIRDNFQKNANSVVFQYTNNNTASTVTAATDGGKTVLADSISVVPASDSGSTVIADITFNPPLTKASEARYIYIVQPNLPIELSLGIAEVEVIGKATRTTQTPGGPAPETRFSMTARPASGAIQKEISYAPGFVGPRSGDVISQSITFTANKEARDVRMEIGLRQKNPGASDFKSVEWSNDFTNFQITVKEPVLNATPKPTISPDFVSVFSDGSRAMNLPGLKTMNPTNVVTDPTTRLEQAHQPIIFANNLSFPAPESTISVTLTGMLRGGMLGNIPQGTEYEMTVRAVKPATLVGGTTESEVRAQSVIVFTIAQ